MTIEQKIFFEALQNIQNAVVATISQEKTLTPETLAYEVSYKMTYRIMELIDGYVTKEINIDIIDHVSGNSLKKGIQLHDMCVEYLREK